jgi:cytochrome c553
MKRYLGIFLGLLSLSSFASAPDLKAGKNTAETVCAACHNKDGNSTNPIWPKIADQHPKYMVEQMKAFKEGKLRNDASMFGMMAPLSDQDMENVAGYFATQERTIGEASPKNLKKGEMIYRGGDQTKQISACIACHGPKGTGNAQAGFPALSGQHPAYVIKQLEDYKSGKRTTDINHIMQDIAAKMDKSDMEWVANYISGLH